MSRIVCACHYYPESLCPENEMTDQLEALRLADRLDFWGDKDAVREASSELRRQHDQIERLAAEVANRNRRALAGDEAVAGLAKVHAYYEGIEAERDALQLRLKLAEAVASAASAWNVADKAEGDDWDEREALEAALKPWRVQRDIDAARSKT